MQPEPEVITIGMHEGWQQMVRFIIVLFDLLLEFLKYIYIYALMLYYKTWMNFNVGSILLIGTLKV